MDDLQEQVARTTLRIAGVFQEISESWAKRLDTYFDQLDSLIQGEWLTPDDFRGILTESKMASHEALNGLGTDLGTLLVHESNGLFARFETDRSALSKEISDLKRIIANLTSKEEYVARKENQTLRKAILNIPSFQVLQVIQDFNQTSYSQLAEKTGMKKRDVRRIVKSLSKQEYVDIDKKKRPHVITFISAPWEFEFNEELESKSKYQSSYAFNAEHSKFVKGPS